MVSNREVSRLFGLYAELLLLHEKNERLSRLLAGASYRIRQMNEEVTEVPKKELVKIFSPQISSLVETLKKSGTIETLNELIQLTPAGLFEMMRIRGLGGKKLALIWKKARVDNMESLLEACKANKLSKIPGFGAKTEANIILAIENYRSSQERYHFASVADTADSLVRTLQSLLKAKELSLCGEVRRQSTTVGAIEILTTLPARKFSSAGMKRHLVVEKSVVDRTTAHTLDEIPVVIYHCNKKDFATRLFELTGNESHVKKVKGKLKSKIPARSEEDIYRQAGLPFIPPELREDVAEWSISKKIDGLLRVEDIRGVVHNHTTWSDGLDDLESFSKACRELQYEYVVISDHSKNAHYAGGLKEDKVLDQLAAIEKLNKKLAPFRIFKSIECDILVSGELDYTSDILQLFDMVIVSVHQLLKMDEQKATKRLIKAIENPYTTILGHMTGRQLLIRPGYPVNYKKVIDACASNNVVIEINANPYRLDMDWSHIPYALKKEVMISINPDSHSIGEIENIRWGVSAARKGGLTKDMTWNAMGLKQIEKWLKRKRAFSY